MFKSLNRTYLALLLTLIGTCSSVFAIDLSQAFTQAQEKSDTINVLFQGKPTVSNLYSKALKLSKDREVVSTTTSFDGLKAYYSDCPGLVTQDFINVLYNSNSSFKETFRQILPKGTKKPSSKEINKSYAKFFSCKGIKGSATADQISALNNDINKVYYDGYSNAYSLVTLNQDNFGSDLFRNGTLDDSSFDLLYDINQIGKLLFENFKDSPEVLFYRLPEAQSVNTQGGGDLSSLSDQGAYQVGGGGGSFPGTTGGPNGTSSTSGSSGGGFSNNSSSSSTSSLVIADKDTLTITGDKEVQNFIESTNNTTPSTPAGAALVFGNQCLSGDDGADAPVVQEKEPVLEDAVTYMSGIVNFINNANLDDVINANLIEQFNKDNPLPPGASTSDSGYADGVANTYAEQAFGEAAQGTCEYSCNGLPLDQQAQCELKCAGTCIQQCGDVSGIQEKALCISDCTCFLIAGPNGAGREKIEDMFRIKFCKVPVEKKTVKPGKKVFSIQAIFQEISDVLEGLRDGGQMVKFSKTKEFLDGNVKINFADNFAFKLQVGFKPVFTQKSTTIKRKEETQANMDLNLGVLDMNASAPEADDYNKYIVVSDPLRNKADLLPATSLAEVNQNIAEFASGANAYTKISSAMIENIKKTYVQGANIGFVQNLITFLQDNQLFRNDLGQALLDINKMSLELKTKIENSK